MNNENLEKLQKIQLEIMDAVHSACEKENIKYYMIGGTLLGAVRHKGFIPWDIDIDIAMRREDYDRFIEIGNDIIDKRFEVQSYKTIENYFQPHVTVVMKNTEVINKFDKYNMKSAIKRHHGIYIDVFPLDNVPSDVKLQKKQAKMIKRIKAWKNLRIGRMYSDKNNIKTILKKLLSGTLGIITVNQFNIWLDNSMKKYGDIPSDNICSMASHYSYTKQNMPKEIYGSPVLMLFEERYFYAPEKSHEYLTRIYGDYMKLPPESEQKSLLESFDNIKINLD